MQDRYAGDVGDFGKLGMLRQIADTGLKVGINWYLSYKPEEHVKEDGKHEKYAFRCILLRLGFIGSEYKGERKILLRNLSGNSTWRNGAPEK